MSASMAAARSGSWRENRKRWRQVSIPPTRRMSRTTYPTRSWASTNPTEVRRARTTWTVDGLMPYWAARLRTDGNRAPGGYSPLAMAKASRSLACSTRVGAAALRSIPRLYRTTCGTVSTDVGGTEIGGTGMTRRRIVAWWCSSVIAAVVGAGGLPPGVGAEPDPLYAGQNVAQVFSGPGAS